MITLSQKEFARLRELLSDGYLKTANGQFVLTMRGLAVLMACADRPAPKPKLPKAPQLRDALPSVKDLAKQAGKKPPEPA